MIWSRKIKIWWIVDMNKVLSSPSCVTTNSQIPLQSWQCVHSISNNTQCPCDHASPISVSDYCEGDGVGSDRVTLHCPRPVGSDKYLVFNQHQLPSHRAHAHKLLGCYIEPIRVEIDSVTANNK